MALQQVIVSARYAGARQTGSGYRETPCGVHREKLRSSSPEGGSASKLRSSSPEGGSASKLRSSSPEGGSASKLRSSSPEGGSASKLRSSSPEGGSASKLRSSSPEGGSASKLAANALAFLAGFGGRSLPEDHASWPAFLAAFACRTMQQTGQPRNRAERSIEFRRNNQPALPVHRKTSCRCGR